MERYEKITILRNEVEALLLRAELEAPGIPHAVQSYYDTALDGLFQFTSGWGQVEAPAERRDEILEILDAIRQQPVPQSADPDESEDNEHRGLTAAESTASSPRPSLRSGRATRP
jgi:hypothetical protein